MNVWAVTMVKDELDVLPYTLKHLASQGVAGIIVADNLSTDGTWEWLCDGANLDCLLAFHGDREIGYYQSDKMTALTHQAFSHGADWVIPFDADELWFCPDGRRVADAVEAEHADCLEVTMHNYFPTSDDDDGEPNPFLRIASRDPERNPLPKVIVRNRRDIVVEQGNHSARADVALFVRPAPVEIAHFPWRSPEQFERKVRNGAAAYRATSLPEEIGAHWRQYGQILDHGGPEALREVYDTWFLDPEKDLEYCPAPWCGLLRL